MSRKRKPAEERLAELIQELGIDRIQFALNYACLVQMDSALWDQHTSRKPLTQRRAVSASKKANPEEVKP